MKSSEYFQLVNAAVDLKNKINLNDILHITNELRKTHKKFQDKMEYLLLDVHTYEDPKTKQEINARALEIREFCNEHKIQVSFQKLPEDFIEFSRSFKEEKMFCSYYFSGVEITKLIVFVEKKKELKAENKKEPSLKDIEFFGDSFLKDEENLLPGETTIN